MPAICAAVAGATWLLLWAHQLATHGTTEVNEQETLLGLTWMDSAKFYVVPFAFAVVAIVLLRPRSIDVAGRIGFAGSALALVGLIVGTAIEFWPFEWGSYAEPADAPHAVVGGVVHAVSSIALTVALVPFAVSLVRARVVRWWEAALLVLAAPFTIFLSPAFPVPAVAWMLYGIGAAGR